MAERWQRSALVLPALLLGACLVQDVELVDSLPGASGSGSGGESASGGMAGSSSNAGSQNEGGDPSTGATGGDDSGGDAGTSSGGSAPGGSAGASGSGGSGPGTMSSIPQNLLDCGSVVNPYVCDTFETQLSPQWPPGTTPGNVIDAPSGKLGLIVNYTETHTLPVDLTALSVSFWVRFPSRTDQRFVSFQDAATLRELGLGIEHERARWIYPDETEAAVAPESNGLTRLLSIDTWACFQARADLFAYTFDAMVVVPGDAPVTLPTLDQNATPEVDEAWNANFPGWTVSNGQLIFGQPGVYQELDDVLVADYDAETLCEKFVALGPD